MKENIEQFDRSGGVPGRAPYETDWNEYEEQHLERPTRVDLTPPRYIPDNMVNHLKNLHGSKGVDGLTGRWRGKWFENGIPRIKI